jgi:gas vesicle protein
MMINLNNKLFYLLAGAAVGVLFAPKAGQEMRSDLSGKVGTLKNKLQEKVQDTGIAEEVTGTVRNVMERGRNLASIGRQRVNESIEAGKRKFNESVESREFRDITDMDLQ